MAVYFIQSGHAGPIKIGYSRNFIARLNALQLINPERLYLRAFFKGGSAVEQYFHKCSLQDWYHGEWFQPSCAINELISQCDPVELAAKMPKPLFRKRLMCRELPELAVVKSLDGKITGFMTVSRAHHLGLCAHKLAVVATIKLSPADSILFNTIMRNQLRDHMIGGWYNSSDIIDEIIDYFGQVKIVSAFISIPVHIKSVFSKAIASGEINRGVKSCYHISDIAEFVDRAQRIYDRTAEKICFTKKKFRPKSGEKSLLDAVIAQETAA